jgi:hypothetical protein
MSVVELIINNDRRWQNVAMRELVWDRCHAAPDDETLERRSTGKQLRAD